MNRILALVEDEMKARIEEWIDRLRGELETLSEEEFLSFNEPRCWRVWYEVETYGDEAQRHVSKAMTHARAMIEAEKHRLFGRRSGVSPIPHPHFDPFLHPKRCEKPRLSKSDRPW